MASYLLTACAGFIGAKAIIEYLPRHPADVEATWADIRKAEKLLGWRPQISLRKGLADLNFWYQENRNWTNNIQTH